MLEVICNTSPIQYLHQVNLLHLLPELYGVIAIPEGVLTELDAGRRVGISLPDVKLLPWLSVKYIRERNLLPMISGLGTGEKGLLDALTPVLDLLDNLQFRLDPKTRKTVLNLAKESS